MIQRKTLLYIFIVIGILTTLFTIITPPSSVFSTTALSRIAPLGTVGTTGECSPRNNDFTANVTPAAGLDYTLFNFTIGVSTGKNITSITLCIGNASTITVLHHLISGGVRTYYVERSFPTFRPGTYNYTFIVETPGGRENVTGANPSISIVSAVRSFMVLPMSGTENTAFLFSVIYENPNGREPTGVSAVIDNNTHYPMRPASTSDDYVHGVNYTISSLSMGINAGVHSYYPVIWINETAHISKNGTYVTFVIEGDEESGGEELEWFENNCCTILVVFIIMVIIMSILHNIIMRTRRKRGGGPPLSRGRGNGTRVGESTCSGCGAMVIPEDTFCPRCGAYFEEGGSISCSRCGGNMTDRDGICSKCGPAIHEGKEDRVRGRGAVRDGIDEVYTKENESTEDTDDDDFICSMCNTTVSGSMKQCPSCGTEFE